MAVGTKAEQAQWAAATAKLAAAGISGIVGPGNLTIAQANALIAAKNATARAVATAAANQQKIANATAVKVANAAARGAKQLAATQTLEAKVQGVLTVRQQNADNLVALRGQNAAQRVSNNITNFSTKLLNQVANNGAKVLTPAFQTTFDAEQAAFANSIQKQGGAYTPIQLVDIAPQLQNSILANQGIGLTNAPTAAQQNALGNLYTSGAIAQALAGNAAVANGTQTGSAAGTVPTGTIATNPAGVTSVTPGTVTVPGVISPGAGVVGGVDFVPPVTPAQVAAALAPAPAASIFGGALGLTDDEWFVVILGGGVVGFLVLSKKHK